jgi:hypothetical protein
MKKNKNLIIAGIAIVILGVAAYMYAGRDQSGDTLLSSQSSSSASGVDDTFLTSLRTLQRLKLDNSLFSSPVWLSLVDFGKTLAQQPAGRPNPFAPLDASSSVSATSSVPR